MFTLPGLPKLLILCLIVWFVWRVVGRMNNVARRDPDGQNGRQSGPRQSNRSGNPTNAQRPQQRAVEDMVQCPKCGAYVPAKGGHDCAGSA
jgi:hypothetical protein